MIGDARISPRHKRRVQQDVKGRARVRVDQLLPVEQRKNRALEQPDDVQLGQQIRSRPMMPISIAPAIQKSRLRSSSR